ncbi:hypothetical protein BC834DRAFT_971816 [Gloeopeniophorella convolvens]|nr:hypothetical protein BC834DRAFT_971816 [Gloeopeniophorella convolvens]
MNSFFDNDRFFEVEDDVTVHDASISFSGSADKEWGSGGKPPIAKTFSDSYLTWMFQLILLSDLWTGQNTFVIAATVGVSEEAFTTGSLLCQVDGA